MSKINLVSDDGRIIYENVIKEYPWIIQKKRRCILSPDCDGLLCGLLMQHLLDWDIVGFYDGKVMLLEDGIKASDCVFLDMEIFRSFTKSLGQHMLMWNSSKDLVRPEWANFDNCISPNNIRKYDGKSKFKMKYPLGTIHLLLGIVGSYQHVDIKKEAICALLYSDGTFKNMFNYPENTLDWLNFLCADDTSNPLYTVFFNNSYTTLNLMKALRSFFNDIHSINPKRGEGDKIKISDGKGQFTNIEKDKGSLWKLVNDKVESVEKFLILLSNLTGWNYKKDKWRFANMRAYSFKKGTIKPNQRNYDEMISKQPLSWAMTSGQVIEYTLEGDKFQ